MTDDAPSTRSGKRQKVHVRIAYPGTGGPVRMLADRCETLVRMLIEGDAGVIDERREGGGAVDIFIITRFSGHTMELVRRACAELGLGDRTTIEIVGSTPKRTDDGPARGGR